MATYIIGGIVVVAMILAGYKAYKDHRTGGCGCGCSGCAQAEKCHQNVAK